MSGVPRKPTFLSCKIRGRPCEHSLENAGSGFRVRLRLVGRAQLPARARLAGPFAVAEGGALCFLRSRRSRRPLLPAPVVDGRRSVRSRTDRTSMRVRSASDRAISRNEIATRAGAPRGDRGLSRHDLVPSQSEQGIDITARILESRNSETKLRVGVKISHGVSPIVCSGCDLIGLSFDGPTRFTNKVGSAGAQFPMEQGLRAARPTRRTWHRHERLNIGQTPFRFGGFPPQLQMTGDYSRSPEAGVEEA